MFIGPPGNTGRRIHLQQRIRNRGHRLIAFQLLERTCHIKERRQQRLIQPPIPAQHVANEWQASGPAFQRIAHERRLEVDHAIAETRLRARAAVMNLIGMNHDDITAHTVGAGTTIHKRLNATQRVTDGVAVVPMWVICMTRKKCIEALESRLRRSARDAVPEGSARSFNTLWTRHGYCVSQCRGQRLHIQNNRTGGCSTRK